MTIKIESLTCYPVKGLSGQPLDRVQLHVGQGFPNDRRFGFARPGSGFDPDNPEPLPKTKFYMLARDASLANLQTEYESDSGTLTISSPDTTGSFNLTTEQGKTDASLFLKSYLTLPDDETPQLYEASPHRFTDVSVDSTEMMNAVSIINLDSIVHLSATIRKPVDPARFRGNICVSGLSPFAELEMVGQELRIGSTHLKIVRRTQRCPATEVNPDTAERDINIPVELRHHYEHRDMGVYAEVLRGGSVALGDSIKL